MKDEDRMNKQIEITSCENRNAKLCNRVVHIAEYMVKILLLCIFIFFSFWSLCYTSYMKIDHVEVTFVQKDSILMNLLFLVIIFILFYGISRFMDTKVKNPILTEQIILGVVMVGTICMSIWWVLQSHCAPYADQQSVSDCAVQFIKGEYASLNYDAYMGWVPYQLGLAGIIELIYRIFGIGNYTAFQIVNACCIPVIVYAGYRIMGLLDGWNSENSSGRVIYLLLIAGCFPLFLYVTFVYGEILSITFCMLAIWMLLSYFQNKKWGKLVLSCLFIGTAIVVRSTAWVVLAAMFLVMVVRAFEERRWQVIVLAIMLLFGTYGISKIPKVVYETRSGIEMGDGVPAIACVTMGMQTGDTGCGWFNNYNYIAYGQALGDSEGAKVIAKADMKLQIEYFKEHPGEALEFYITKLTSQWNNPTYQCIQMNNIHNEELTGIAESVFSGNLFYGLQNFMNYYQAIIYLGVLCYIVLQFRRKSSIKELLLPVIIIGGFILSIIWEAKARYMLLYFIMMIPIAGMGISSMIEKIHNLINGTN